MNEAFICAGAKGIISLDTRLFHIDTIKLRPSMLKFPSRDDGAIEIYTAVRKPWLIFFSH